MVWTTRSAPIGPWYDKGMIKEKEKLVHVRVYGKEHGILRRLAFRKGTTIAEVIRQLIKG
jgi:hypothetical protein